MKLSIPKIAREKLSEIQSETFDTLNADNYGEDLATKVFEKLIQSKTDYDGIYFIHRDYCGIGLFFHHEKFILSTVYDGYGPDQPILEIDSNTEFLEWLANENDQSMALYGDKFNNQTITKLRLDWYLEDNYSPGWNEYRDYIKQINK